MSLYSDLPSMALVLAVLVSLTAVVAIGVFVVATPVLCTCAHKRHGKRAAMVFAALMCAPFAMFTGEVCGYRAPTTGPVPPDRRVYDCTWVNKELDMLRGRMDELDSVVDKFVVVESPMTFGGKAKPLFFKDAIATKFAKYQSKIVHVVVNATAEFASMKPFDKQAYQRSHIMLGLEAAGARAHDIVLASDVDELVRASTIEYIRDVVPDSEFPVALDLTTHVYDFGCTIRQPGHWMKVKVALHNQLQFQCTDDPWASRVCPDLLRDRRYWRWVLRRYTVPSVLPDAGWHLTNFLPMEGIINKMQSAAHQERREHATPANIKCLVSQCRGLFNGDVGERHPVDTSRVPQAMLTNPAFMSFLSPSGGLGSASAKQTEEEMALQSRLAKHACGGPSHPFLKWALSNHMDWCGVSVAYTYQVSLVVAAAMLVLSVLFSLVLRVVVRSIVPRLQLARFYQAKKTDAPAAWKRVSV